MAAPPWRSRLLWSVLLGAAIVLLGQQDILVVHLLEHLKGCALLFRCHKIMPLPLHVLLNLFQLLHGHYPSISCCMDKLNCLRGFTALPGLIVLARKAQNKLFCALVRERLLRHGLAQVLAQLAQARELLLGRRCAGRLLIALLPVGTRRARRARGSRPAVPVAPTRILVAAGAFNGGIDDAMLLTQLVAGELGAIAQHG